MSIWKRALIIMLALVMTACSGAPAASAPVASAPAVVSSQPAESAPVEAAPAVSESQAAEPAPEQPASEAPAAEEPASEAPAAEEPASEAPAAEEPASEAPAAEQTKKKPTEKLPTDAEYNILFIGNSHTYYNSMPQAIFPEIAKKAGYKNVNVDAVTKGAATLDLYTNKSSAEGAQVAKLLETKKYDYVVFQENGKRAGIDSVMFYISARYMAKMIRENGAIPILYCTQGYKDGESFIRENGLDTEMHTWKTAAAYKAISDELDIAVAYSGLAFYDIYSDKDTDIELYNDDMYHPSKKGSYLAALTIFSTIFNVDPLNVPVGSDLSAKHGKRLHEAAHVAVMETPQIPAEYVTTSKI